MCLRFFGTFGRWNSEFDRREALQAPDCGLTFLAGKTGKHSDLQHFDGWVRDLPIKGWHSATCATFNLEFSHCVNDMKWSIMCCCFKKLWVGLIHLPRQNAKNRCRSEQPVGKGLLWCHSDPCLWKYSNHGWGLSSPLNEMLRNCGSPRCTRLYRSP